METDVVCVFLEAAAANIKAILANDSDARSAGTAAARALAVTLWMGAPDVLVTHFDEKR